MSRKLFQLIISCVYLFFCGNKNSVAQTLQYENLNDYLYPIELNNKWGYIDSTGKIIIQPYFSYTSDFINGLGLVNINADTIGFLNAKGDLIIKSINPEPNYKYPHFLSEGLLAICDSSTRKYGYVNKYGEWIIKPKFYKVEDFSNGVAAVWENADIHSSDSDFTPTPHPKWGFIDHKGNYVIQPIYYEVSKFYDNYALVEDKIINKSGNEINVENVSSKTFLNHRFQLTHNLMYISENIFVPSNDENFSDAPIMFMDTKLHRYGFKNFKGEIIIPTIYADAQFFSENLAAVETPDGWWGYIDTTGKIFIKPQFGLALPFCEGLAPVTHEGKWGFIDTSGNFLIMPIFEEVDDFNVLTRFWGGYSRVLFQKKMCYVNRKGKIIWKAP